MHVALPKRPMNLFQLVELSRQQVLRAEALRAQVLRAQGLRAQALRAYCPNVYTVPICMKLANWN